MLEYFAKINDELGKRCDTLLCDIRSGSSSFFSSYRSLIECFIKTVIGGTPYCEPYSGKTLIYMLSSEELTEYFVGTVGVDAAAHKRVKNYILKINRQVHEREKELDDELAKSYTHALYDFTAPYARSLGITVPPLTDSDILDEFMSYSEEILNSEERRRGYEDAMSSISKYIEFMDTEIEEKEAEMLEEVKSGSVKYLAYFGTKRDHDRRLWRCLILCAVIVCSGAIGTLIGSLTVNFYFIFDLVANIYLIRMILFAFRISKTTSVIKLHDATELMPMDFVRGIPIKLNKYKVALGFVIAFYLFNILLIILDTIHGNLSPLFSFAYTLMAIIFVVASIMMLREAVRMYKSYIAFAYKYVTRDNKIYTFFEVPAIDRYFKVEEYKRDIYGEKTIKFPK